MKFSRANLLEIVMLAERDFSYENIAARLDCARKSIYNWLSESRARADAGEGAESPYYVVERGDHFHNLMAAARKADPRKLPPMPLNSEEQFAENARIDDEAEALIEDAIVERSQVVSADQLRTDIEELRAYARAWAAQPKTPGRVKEIFGRHVPGDPVEHVTGRQPEPPPKSVAQREREHPRRYDQEIPPLHKPDPPPWQKPAPSPSLNAATIGATTMPPSEGRFSMSRLDGVHREVSRAEARAGTHRIVGGGVRED